MQKIELTFVYLWLFMAVKLPHNFTEPVRGNYETIAVVALIKAILALPSIRKHRTKERLPVCPKPFLSSAEIIHVQPAHSIFSWSDDP
jgi:hypothetical protein